MPVISGEDHDERYVPQHRRRLDPATYLLASQARHLRVEEHAVDRLSGEHLEGHLAGMCDDDVVAIGAKCSCNLMAIDFTVVYHQDALRAQQRADLARGTIRAPQDCREARQDDFRIAFLADERVSA